MGALIERTAPTHRALAAGEDRCERDDVPALNPLDRKTDLEHPTDTFMPDDPAGTGQYRRRRGAEIAGGIRLQQMQVRSADAGVEHLDPNVIGRQQAKRTRL